MESRNKKGASSPDFCSGLEDCRCDDCMDANLRADELELLLQETGGFPEPMDVEGDEQEPWDTYFEHQIYGQARAEARDFTWNDPRTAEAEELRFQTAERERQHREELEDAAQERRVDEMESMMQEIADNRGVDIHDLDGYFTVDDDGHFRWVDLSGPYSMQKED